MPFKSPIHFSILAAVLLALIGCCREAPEPSSFGNFTAIKNSAQLEARAAAIIEASRAPEQLELHLPEEVIAGLFGEDLILLGVYNAYLNKRGVTLKVVQLSKQLQESSDEEIGRIVGINSYAYYRLQELNWNEALNQPVE